LACGVGARGCRPDSYSTSRWRDCDSTSRWRDTSQTVPTTRRRACTRLPLAVPRAKMCAPAACQARRTPRERGPPHREALLRLLQQIASVSTDVFQQIALCVCPPASGPLWPWRTFSEGLSGRRSAFRDAADTLPPTKLMARISAASQIKSTALLEPCTTFKTPAGRPASAASFARSMAVEGT